MSTSAAHVAARRNALSGHSVLNQSDSELSAGLFEQILALQAPLEPQVRSSPSDEPSRVEDEVADLESSSSREKPRRTQEDKSEEPSEESSVDDGSDAVAASQQVGVEESSKEQVSQGEGEVVIAVDSNGQEQAVQTPVEGATAHEVAVPRENGIKGEQQADATVVKAKPINIESQSEGTTPTGIESAPQQEAVTVPSQEQVIESSEQAVEVVSQPSKQQFAGSVTEENTVENRGTQAVESVGEFTQSESEEQLQQEGESQRDPQAGKREKGQPDKWFEVAPGEVQNSEFAAQNQQGQPAEASARVPDGQLVEPLPADASLESLSNDEASLSTRPTTENVAATIAVDGAARSVASEPTTQGRRTNESIKAAQNGLSTEPEGPTTTGKIDKAEAAANERKAAQLSRNDQIRLINRVSRSFSRLGPDGGQVQLRLHPPQLGVLNMQVRMEGRSMTAKLATESVAAQEAIVESLPVLRQRLAEQGIEISQFQVEVAENGADANFGNGNSASDYENSSERRERPLRWTANASNDNSEPTASPANVNALSHAGWDPAQGIDVQA